MSIKSCVKGEKNHSLFQHISVATLCVRERACVCVSVRAAE